MVTLSYLSSMLQVFFWFVRYHFFALVIFDCGSKRTEKASGKKSHLVCLLSRDKWVLQTAGAVTVVEEKKSCTRDQRL